MAARYRIWLRDQAGARTAWVDGWYYLRYVRRLAVLGVGFGELQLPAIHWTVEGELYPTDGEVFVLRRPEGVTTWNAEHAGLIRYGRDFYEGGEDRFVAITRAPENLLDRRLIVPPDGESHDVQGPDFADVVLKTYVNDHAGPGAGARAIPTLYVQAVNSEGEQIQEEARYYRLFDTLQRLAEAGEVDFDVVPVFTDALLTWEECQAAGRPDWARVRAGWLFRVSYPQQGVDHRRGNADGNPVVVFSLERGNMEEPDYVADATDIGNYCYVLGQGVGEERAVTEVFDAASVAESPYNTWEFSRDARNTELVASLAQKGEESLIERQRRTDFSFTALESLGCLYGVHYNLGDWATAEYRGVEFDVRCVEIEVSVSQSEGERVKPLFRADL